MAVGTHSVWIVCALKQVQAIVDAFLGLVFGYKTSAGWREEEERAKKRYENSAQLVSILYKGAYNAIWEHGPHNFLYVHENYVNPNFVLQHDEVSIQAITPTHVLFAVVGRGVDVYDMDKHPFVMLAQYLEMKKLIMVPMWAMYKLSEGTGDPVDREIIGYGMTARSGSTLLTQMFRKLPKTVAMSEPWALFHAHKFYSRGQIPEENYHNLILAILRLQFKKLHHIPCERMVIKLTLFTSAQQEIIKKVFPCMKLFYNARHPKKSMISYCHAILAPVQGNMLTHQFHEYWTDSLPIDYKNEKLMALKRRLMKNREPRVETAAFARDCGYMYGATVDYYVNNKGLYLRCVLYENLMEDPEAETSKLFELLGLSQDLVPLALTALQKHSQGHIFGDPKEDDGRRKFGPKEFDEINAAFKDMDLPIHTEMPLEEFKALMS